MDRHAQHSAFGDGSEDSRRIYDDAPHVVRVGYRNGEMVLWLSREAIEDNDPVVISAAFGPARAFTFGTYPEPPKESAAD